MTKTVYVTVKLTIADEVDVNEVVENMDYNFSYLAGSPEEGKETYFGKYGEAIYDTEIVETEVK